MYVTLLQEVELWNMTRYEVKIYAVTQSVCKEHGLVNGAESPPEVRTYFCLSFVYRVLYCL